MCFLLRAAHVIAVKDNVALFSGPFLGGVFFFFFLSHVFTVSDYLLKWFLAEGMSHCLVTENVFVLKLFIMESLR